jgi:hypothetical protein
MSELETMLPSGFPEEEIESMKKEYMRLRKIELLLQQYLFCCEYEAEGEVKERIKRTIEKKLKELEVTNEDKLVALYHLDMPTKGYDSTKRMIEEYEKITNKEKAKDRLHKILMYEHYQYSLRLKELEEMSKRYRRRHHRSI